MANIVINKSNNGTAQDDKVKERNKKEHQKDALNQSFGNLAIIV